MINHQLINDQSLYFLKFRQKIIFTARYLFTGKTCHSLQGDTDKYEPGR